MSPPKVKVIKRRAYLEPSEMEAAAAPVEPQYPTESDEDMAKVIACAKLHFKIAATADASGYAKKFRAKINQRDENTKAAGLKRVAEDLEMDPGHLNLTCQAVSDMLKKKTVEEVHEIFDISKDFPPEEQEECRILLQHVILRREKRVIS